MQVDEEVETCSTVLSITQPATLQLHLVPEGGFFGCSLPNRVYFQALDAANRSVAITAVIVHNASIIAPIDTDDHGRGRSHAFQMEPAQRYGVLVTAPAAYAGREFPLGA